MELMKDMRTRASPSNICSQIERNHNIRATYEKLSQEAEDGTKEIVL